MHVTMICANCRQHHQSIQDVRACFNADKPDCSHELPAGQCVCTWELNLNYVGTHQYVVRSRYEGFCTACMNHYTYGSRIVRSSYTWGRWIHLECLEEAHHVWTSPEDDKQDALGSKPWLEELGVPRQMLECEDSFFIDPRDEIEDTDDALQELLVSEGISSGLITEWREMLPDVVDRTILMELADQLVEVEVLEDWELEVELMHLAHADSR